MIGIGHSLVADHAVHIWHYGQGIEEHICCAIRQKGFLVIEKNATLTLIVGHDHQDIRFARSIWSSMLEAQPQPQPQGKSEDNNASGHISPQFTAF